jgi:hypothetical protein
MRAALVHARGLSYSAETYIELFYPGTQKPMTHTITKLWVRDDEDQFFM